MESYRTLGGGSIDGYFGKNPDWSKIKVKTGRTIWSSYDDNTLQAWLVEDINSGGVALAGGNYANPIQIAGNGLPRIAGYFVDGFVFENPNQVGIDASGNSWRYVGTSPLPYTVTAGTVPSAPDYEKVFESTASNVTTSNDGSVQDYINENLTPFKNVSEMKGYDYTGIPEYTIVNVQGYYEQSDGGSFKGELRFGAHTDDGGSIHSINSNTYIKVFLGSNVNIRKFGASPNLPDNSTQINNAILKSLSIKVPSGVFNCKNVNVADGLTLFGVGDAILNLVGSNDGDSIIRDLEKQSVKNVTFKGLKFTGNASYLSENAYNAVHLSIESPTEVLSERIVFEACDFYGFSRAIYVTNTRMVRVDNCNFYNCYQTQSGTRGYGVLAPRCHDVIVSRCYFDNTVMRHSVYTSSDCVNVKIVSCDFNVNSDDNYRPTGYEHPIKFLDTVNASVINCSFSGGYQSVLLDSVAKNIIIDDCIFDGAEGLVYASSTTVLSSIIISNNIGDFVSSTKPRGNVINVAAANDFRLKITGNDITAMERIISTGSVGVDIRSSSNTYKTSSAVDYCFYSSNGISTVIGTSLDLFSGFTYNFFSGKISASASVSDTVDWVQFSQLGSKSSACTPNLTLSTRNLTSNTVISTLWSGETFTNISATNSRTHQFPEAKKGMKYSAIKTNETWNIGFSVATGDYFRAGSPNSTATITAKGEVVEFSCFENGVWDVLGDVVYSS